MSRELKAPPATDIAWAFGIGGDCKWTAVKARTWFAARTRAAVELKAEPGDLILIGPAEYLDNQRSTGSSKIHAATKS